jgi:hypothetical protein
VLRLRQRGIRKEIEGDILCAGAFLRRSRSKVQYSIELYWI